MDDEVMVADVDPTPAPAATAPEDVDPVEELRAQVAALNERVDQLAGAADEAREQGEPEAAAELEEAAEAVEEAAEAVEELAETPAAEEAEEAVEEAQEAVEDAEEAVDDVVAEAAEEAGEAVAEVAEDAGSEEAVEELADAVDLRDSIEPEETHFYFKKWGRRR